MVAAQYIKAKRQFDRPVRFDIIELLGDGINHIENAYDSRIRM
jgi:Holliday junction resolvase-like predicted endonuclease